MERVGVDCYLEVGDLLSINYLFFYSGRFVVG